MSLYKEEDGVLYKVVVNEEGQYSIWPAERETPSGWRDAGPRGTKAKCLAAIDEMWTDLRPLRLRRQMEEVGDDG